MKILETHKLTDEKWVNLYAVSYENKGSKGRWVFATRAKAPYTLSKGDAVVIIALLRQAGKPARLVLARELRVPVGGYVYGLPAGLIEAGEQVEEAVRRELREETGFEVTTFHKITPPLYSTPGLTDESALLAFVEAYETPESKQALEGGEDIEVVLVDQQQATELVADTSIAFDAKAWLACYQFSLTGRVV